MSEERRGLQRMERLVDVRQTFVTAAEAAVREAEGMVRYFEDEIRDNARQIFQAREENAYFGDSKSNVITARERYILSLQQRARSLAQDLEKAKQLVERRRTAWREAMKARKTVEGVKERRLHEWTRSVDAADQKRVDEMTIGKHVRQQSRVVNEPAGASPADSKSKNARR